MIKLNLYKCGLGIVASLALGLSGCYMDEQRSQQEMHTAHGQAATSAPAHKAESKAATTTHAAAGHKESASASRKPVQQEAPGPKRAAAPQLPVIQ